jgi:LuxR family maltose regulon positive regulatory protein
MLTSTPVELLRWLKALPDEHVRTRPVLSAYYALALLPDDLEAAEAQLRDAERLLDATAELGERREASSAEMVVVDDGEFQALPGTIAIVRAYLAGAFGDVSGILHHARRAWDLLPEDDHLWRGAAAALLGLAYWTIGDLEAAYRAFVDGWAIMRLTGDRTREITGAFLPANIRTAQGRLREATSLYEQSLARAAGQGGPTPPSTADLYVG